MKEIVARAEIPAETWDAFVAQHPQGWFWHTSAWLDYSLAYAPDAEDLSKAVIAAGRIVGLAPLLREGDSLTVGGNPGPVPLGSDGFPAPWSLTLDTGARRAAFRTMPGDRLDDFPATAGAVIETFPSYVLPLTPRLDALKTGIRGSYKNLINRSIRKIGVEPGVFAKGWAVREAQKLHRQAAGRDTRAQATWDQMAQWADDGYAIVALDHGLQGYALAIRFGSWAYYASGATLIPNVAHGLQWALIQALKAGDLRHYEIGWGPREGDSEKDRNIAVFKGGFGGQPWSVTTATFTF